MAKKQTPSHDDIAAAAYHRYLKRGESHGGDFTDWLEAERELTRSSATPNSQRPTPKAPASRGPVAKAPSRPAKKTKT